MSRSRGPGLASEGFEGKPELEFWGARIEKPSGWTSYTIKGDAALPGDARALPDVVELQVYTNELFYGLVRGNWSLEPAGGQDRPGRGELWWWSPDQTNHPGRTAGGTVSKAVVAPSGRRTGAHRRGRLIRRGTYFILRDDQGNYAVQAQSLWPWFPAPIRARLEFLSTFYGGRAGHGSPSPWCPMGGSTPVMNQAARIGYPWQPWTNCPLTDEGAETGYTLLSLDVGAGAGGGPCSVTGEELLQC